MEKEDWATATRDRRIEIIAAGRADGLSYLQIAKTRFRGATKSAVIGLANRAGIMAGGGHAIPVRRPVRTIKPKSSNLPVDSKNTVPVGHGVVKLAETRPEPYRPVISFPTEPVVILSPSDQVETAVPVTLMEAGPRQCRWPLWGPDERDPTGHLVCGKRCDGSYCEEHKARSVAAPRNQKGDLS